MFRNITVLFSLNAYTKVLPVLSLAAPLFLSHPIFASNNSDGSSPPDPYISTNYRAAFDISILADFTDVLDVEGISLAGLPPSVPGCWSRFCPTLSGFQYAAVDQDPSVNLSGQQRYSQYIQRKAEMEKALLAQLYSQKSRSSWRPTGIAASGVAAMLPVSGAGFAATQRLPESQQALALWPLMEVFYKTSDCIRAAMSSVYISLVPTNDPFFEMEVEFAKKLPYASEKERDLIIRAFGTERAGRTYKTEELSTRIRLIKSRQAQITDFYEEVPEPEENRETDHPTSMVTHSRNHPTSPLNPLNLDDEKIRNYLSRYFENYENAEEAKIAITAAVKGYFNKTKLGIDTGAYTLLLQGPYGIGKSHFAKALKSLLSELFQEEFPFELVSYTSESDLLGTDNVPGAILTAIANISQEFGIIFLDEGNLDDLDRIAKLLFDSGGTDYPYPFLRGGKKSLKNYFVVVCTNKSIEDEAIGSRLIQVDYPRPKKTIINSVVRGHLRDTLPKDTSKETLKFYLDHPATQSILWDSQQLRLRDQVQRAVETIQSELQKERQEQETARIKGDFLKKITPILGEDKMANHFIQNLMREPDFWSKSEEERRQLIIQKSLQAEIWINRISARTPGISTFRTDTD